MSGGLVFRQEALSAHLDQALPLFEQHSAEVGALGGAKAKFDFSYLATLEACGAVTSTLAFTEGRLMGYLLWYVSETSLEYAGLKNAAQGPWFLVREARGRCAGAAMFRWSLVMLKAAGVWVCFPHRWERSPEALGDLFESLGAVPMERSWWLGMEKI